MVEESKIELNRQCLFCSQSFSISVPVQDYLDWCERRKHAQEAFPYLSPSMRELIISGVCGTCFDSLFQEEEPL